MKLQDNGHKTKKGALLTPHRDCRLFVVQVAALAKLGNAGMFAANHAAMCTARVRLFVNITELDIKDIWMM